MALNSDIFGIFGLLAVPVILLLWAGFDVYRKRVRRKSLRQRKDGTFVWIEWHGAERSALDDPSEPGGLWDSEGGDGFV